MLVFGCAIFISAIAQGGPRARYLRSNHHFPPGHIIVDRAPNFGWNLGFNLLIDGQSVGSVAQGHSFSTWLPAGTHVLTVHKVPATGFMAPTSTTVNIQPGAEHLYTAVWDSGLIYLHPGGVWFTPGADAAGKRVLRATDRHDSSGVSRLADPYARGPSPTGSS